MIQSVINILKNNSVSIYSDFKIGPTLLFNNSGEDLYPLIWVEEPFIIEENSTTNKFTIRFSFFSLLKREEEDTDNSISRISECFNLGFTYISLLRDLGYIIDDFSSLTYNGVERSIFTDSVDGVRFELSISIPICLR